MSKSLEKTEDTTAAAAPTLERRDVLGMLGIGGLLLALPGGVTQAASAAAQATPTPDECGPPQPCPDTKPSLPGTPDISKLPGLAQFIGTLARDAADARTNRRHFNTCPDKFLNFYTLNDADVAALLDFNQSNVHSQFVYLGTKVSPANAADYAAFLNLYVATDSFWKGWDTFSPKDCYDDKLDCAKGIDEAYARPNTRIMNVEQKRVGDDVELVVSAEGLVRSPAIDVVPAGGGTPIQVAGQKVDSQSTFRCGRITGTAKLTKGEKYVVQMTVAKSLIRTSDVFEAV